MILSLRLLMVSLFISLGVSAQKTTYFEENLYTETSEKKAKWIPATEDGEPIESYTVLPIHFTLN